VQQSKLFLVMRLPQIESVESWVGRRLFFSMFGGGSHSRLFREVREKQSLAYYVSATVDRHKGLAMVQLGLDESSAAPADQETEEVMMGRQGRCALRIVARRPSSQVASGSGSAATAHSPSRSATR